MGRRANGTEDTRWERQKEGTGRVKREKERDREREGEMENLWWRESGPARVIIGQIAMRTDEL